jgi:flagellar basal body P-ring formation protein FlgA
MMPLAAFAIAGCLAVAPASDRILASDLAPAFPAFSGSFPDASVGIAPAAGVHRLFLMPELARVAERLKLGAPPVRDLCFERPLIQLDPARLIVAMQKSLPGAGIDIVDFNRGGAPEGEIEFPRAGLRRTPSGAYWNGMVHYAGMRRYLIWAKVRITVTAVRVVAAESIPAGKPIESGQVRVEQSSGFPSAVAYAGSLEEVCGRQLRRSVVAGTALRAEWLQAAQDVRAGENVKVEVRSGAARLEFDGQAAGSASAGEAVWVINPETHKRFAARVEAPGKVTVERGKQ